MSATINNLMDSAGFQALQGWSTGHLYAMSKNREDEVKQGGSYYLSAFSQVFQIFMLGGTISKISSTALSGKAQLVAKIFASAVPMLLLPITLTAGVVKSQLYTGFGPRTTKVLNFLAEHTGNIARVAMVASAIALIVLGKEILGAAMLAAMGYAALDKYGFIPHRISLFVERYIGTVSTGLALISGNLPSRIFHTIVLGVQVIPNASQKILEQMDKFVRNKFKIAGPSLIESYAPLKENLSMSYDEIVKTLGSSSYQFEIDTAHCTKQAIDLTSLPKSDQYSQLMVLLEQYDWESPENYQLLLAKFKVDERFLLAASKTLGCQKSEIALDFDKAVRELAAKENTNPQKLLANQFHTQMQTLVDQLNGKFGTAIKGDRKLLEEGKHNCQIIIPYLQAAERSPIERQDILLKLGVEAGGYCTLALRDSSHELLLQILQGFAEKQAQANLLDDSPQSAYILKVRSFLQETRRAILQESLAEITPPASLGISNDRDFTDSYKKWLGIGFYPTSADEQAAINIGDIATSWFCPSLRVLLYTNYKTRIDRFFEEGGFTQNEHVLFMQQTINNHPKLTDAQKEELLDGWINKNYSDQAFQRLFFVMLGVLKLKKSDINQSMIPKH